MLQLFLERHFPSKPKKEDPESANPNLRTFVIDVNDLEKLRIENKKEY